MEPVLNGDGDCPGSNAAPTVRCIYPVPDVGTFSEAFTDLLEPDRPGYRAAQKNHEIQQVLPRQPLGDSTALPRDGVEVGRSPRFGGPQLKPVRLIQRRQAGSISEAPWAKRDREQLDLAAAEFKLGHYQ